MLIKREHLDGIARGEISLAFRLWKRATVRAGGTLRTKVGVLAIEEVEIVPERKISTADAKKAGFASREELLLFLRSREKSDAQIYRVQLRLEGDDPRIALRKRAGLSQAEVTEIAERLARYDRASKRGPWTRTVLEMIAEQPETRAEDLAASVGWEKKPFKANVRKLKELGLTESMKIGYRLSPRGQALLRRLPVRSE